MLIDSVQGYPKAPMLWGGNFRSKRRRYRQALLLKQKLGRNLVDELHYQGIAWLVKTYRVTLLPIFGASRMVRGRRLRKVTKRSMLNGPHFKFRQRLLHKAELTAGRTVILCDEPFSSKTCGACGHIHDNLGGRKVFKDPKCNFKADGDAAAARNILMRWCTLKQPRP